MKIKITSLLGSKQKTVTNIVDLSSLKDLDAVIRAVVTDRTATLTRVDGKQTDIVYCGTVRDEVYNQKQLLVDWCNLLVDEFPDGGLYRGASV